MVQIYDKPVCKICDKEYYKLYNLKRHIVTIHGFNYQDYLESFDANNLVDDIVPTERLVIKAEKLVNNNDVMVNNKIKHLCSKCNKNFSANWYLKKHIEKCKGFIDIYSCEYCKKKFTHRDSRYNHYKICKTKKEVDEIKKEKGSNTIIKTITFEINKNEYGSNRKNGIVYLVQPEELIDTNRYKIGCSSKTSIERLKTYKKGMNCILVAKCIEPFIVEKEIIKEFNNLFTVVAGKEYYEGNEPEMIAKFLEVYLKHSC